MSVEEPKPLGRWGQTSDFRLLIRLTLVPNFGFIGSVIIKHTNNKDTLESRIRLQPSGSPKTHVMPQLWNGTTALCIAPTLIASNPPNPPFQPLDGRPLRHCRTTTNGTRALLSHVRDTQRGEPAKTPARNQGQGQVSFSLKSRFLFIDDGIIAVDGGLNVMLRGQLLMCLVGPSVGTKSRDPIVVLLLPKLPWAFLFVAYIRAGLSSRQVILCASGAELATSETPHASTHTLSHFHCTSLPKLQHIETIMCYQPASMTPRPQRPHQSTTPRGNR